MYIHMHCKRTSSLQSIVFPRTSKGSSTSQQQGSCTQTTSYFLTVSRTTYRFFHVKRRLFFTVLPSYAPDVRMGRDFLYVRALRGAIGDRDSTEGMELQAKNQLAAQGLNTHLLFLLSRYPCTSQETVRHWRQYL